MPKLIAKYLFIENNHRTASTSLYPTVLTIVNNPVQLYVSLFSEWEEEWGECT